MRKQKIGQQVMLEEKNWQEESTDIGKHEKCIDYGTLSFGVYDDN